MRKIAHQTKIDIITIALKWDGRVKTSTIARDECGNLAKLFLNTNEGNDNYSDHVA